VAPTFPYGVIALRPQPSPRTPRLSTPKALLKQARPTQQAAQCRHSEADEAQTAHSPLHSRAKIHSLQPSQLSNRLPPQACSLIIRRKSTRVSLHRCNTINPTQTALQQVQSRDTCNREIRIHITTMLQRRTIFLLMTHPS